MILISEAVTLVTNRLMDYQTKVIFIHLKSKLGLQNVMGEIRRWALVREE